MAIQPFFSKNYFFDFNKWEKQFKKDILIYAENAKIINANEKKPYKFEYQGTKYIIWDGEEFEKNIKKNFKNNFKNLLIKKEKLNGT